MGSNTKRDKWNVSLEWNWSGLGPKYITHYSAIQN